MARPWLRIDEHEDVLSSTNLLSLIAPRLEKHPSSWKWMIVAAHNGVQGAIVCAIQDSTGTNILTKQSAAEMLNWLDSLSGERPTEILADFSLLVKKFRKQYPHALAAAEHQKIRKLHREFRNKFAHFTPTHWSIQISMLKELVIAALDLIEVAMKQDQVVLKLSGKR